MGTLRAERRIMIAVRELAYILPRMLLFGLFAGFGLAGSEFIYGMADEVDHDLPLQDRTSLKPFALRMRFWEMLRKHRLMYPKSTLRRKIGMMHALGGITFLILVSSLAWPFPAP